MASDAAFQEEQPLRGTWVGALVFAGGALVLVLFGYAVVRQFLLGLPVGSRPAPDWVLAVFGLILLPVGGGLLYLALRGCLTVRVDAGGLFVRFHPLVRPRTIPWDRIDSCEAVTYRPVLEYGGWGVRYGWKGGMAYNISGNRGVRVRFKDGKQLLLGSRQPEALASSMRERLGA